MRHQVDLKPNERDPAEGRSNRRKRGRPKGSTKKRPADPQLSIVCIDDECLTIRQWVNRINECHDGRCKDRITPSEDPAPQ